MNTKQDPKSNSGKLLLWYAEKTKLEKILMIGFAVLFIIFLITFFLGIRNYDNISKTCLTPNCIHEASFLLKNIDESINPCDDFYEFACGNFLKETSIPESKSSVNTFGNIAEKVQQQIKLMVDNDLPPNATRTYRLIKELYNMCMNTTALETDGLKIILDELNKLDEWPLLVGQKWNANAFDWKKAEYKFIENSFSSGHLIGVYISSDNKNSTRRVVKITSGYIPLSREFMINGMNDTHVKNYYEFIVDLAVLYGADKNSAQKELKDIIEFATKLANITLKRESRRNPMALYNPRTLKELNQQYPYLDWVEYLNNILVIENNTFTENEPVIIDDLDYFKNLEKLIEETPKRVLANYFMTLMYESVTFLLPERFRKRKQEYYQTISGNSEATPQWKKCLGVATSTIGLTTASTYIKKYFNEKAKMNMEEMITNIRTEFVENIRNSKWMDEMTKQRAIEKANSIVEYIGYPNELLDDNNIETFYSNLTINFTNYYEALKSVNIFYKNYYYSKFRKPINKTDWLSHSSSTTVNAFYSSLQNSIEFPAGILQGVFFHSERPHYMNYGGIGYVIGHEITHGFDDVGRQYDIDGNLKDWWSNHTKSAFIDRAQCIIHQYGNYTVPEIDMKLNGINTQGENIADNGGIKEAYLAYNRWVKSNGQEPKLPGLKYTPNQLFWISAANIYCTKIRKKTLQNQIKTAAHSVGRFRVIGPFSNSKYFAKDFNCPIGSKMNPVKKCEVW